MSLEKRNFGWKSRHDSRSKNYGIRSLLASKQVKKQKVMWEEGVVLDQGSEGACVGFAWMGELLAHPVPPESQPTFEKGNRVAYEFYRRAQQIDEWPGEDYDGTSVLAGAKVMRERGFILEFRWCFSIEDVRDTIISSGPVVVGVPWYSGMYETTKTGLVKISGEIVGGHALVITGYDPAMRFGSKTYEVFRWRNSWNTDYGINGSGYIKAEDLLKLLRQQGEACVPIGRSVPVFWEKDRAAETKKIFWNCLKNIWRKR